MLSYSTASRQEVGYGIKVVPCLALGRKRCRHVSRTRIIQLVHNLKQTRWLRAFESVRECQR